MKTDKTIYVVIGGTSGIGAELSQQLPATMRSYTSPAVKPV